MQQEQTKYITRKQLARRWACSIETIKRKEKSGLICPTKFGQRFVRYKLTSTFHKIQESKPKALKAISRRLSEATPPVAEVVSTSRRDGSALPCKFRLLRTFQVRLILANQSPVVASLKPGLIAIKPSVLKI